jgi:hypothetical protein
LLPGAGRRRSVTERAVDKRDAPHLVARVSRLRSLVALVLLTLWLPITQHCGLEAAGLIEADASHDAVGCCRESSDPCTHDGCAVVESGFTKPALVALKVAPPAAACACLLCLPLWTPEPAAVPVLTAASPDRPLDWVPAWHFVRRAAPLSRAPSTLA